MEIGPEKVRICFKKWSGFGPILENIGPIQDLGALESLVLKIVFMFLSLGQIILCLDSLAQNDLLQGSEVT